VQLLFKLLSQCRDNLEQITYNAIISNIKNGRIRICVDGNNDLRCFHARQMLYLAGNSAGNIQDGGETAT